MEIAPEKDDRPMYERFEVVDQKPDWYKYFHFKEEDVFTVEGKIEGRTVDKVRFRPKRGAKKIVIYYLDNNTWEKK